MNPLGWIRSRIDALFSGPATSAVPATLGTSLGGVGSVAGIGEVVSAPPDAEVVTSAGSWVGIGPYNLQVLSDRINSQDEKLDSWVVRAMLDDPAVYSSHETHKAAVLSSELKVHPAFGDGAEGEVPPGGDPEEAKRAAEECRAALARLPVPVEVWGGDALDARAYGHKVAELVLDYVPDGPTSGRYTLGALKMKPRWSYHLCTDPFYNLVAIYCQTAFGSAYVAKDHFVVFSWDVKDNDPRGSSRFRAAKDPWRRKLRAKDSRSKSDDQFGTPSIAHELPAAAPLESKNPNNPGGPPITTVEAAQIQMQRFAGGGCVAYGNGGDIKVIESQRDGVQIGNSVDYYDREITRALLLQDRATMNAEHYTQGGSDAGQDIMSDDVAITKRWFCSVLEKQVLWRMLATNRGPAYAEMYTPKLTLGAIDLRKFAELATPIAVMMQASGLTRSQLTKFFAMFGLPVPLPGELRIGPSGAVPDTVPEPKAPAPPTTPAKEAA